MALEPAFGFGAVSVHTRIKCVAFPGLTSVRRVMQSIFPAWEDTLLV